MVAFENNNLIKSSDNSFASLISLFLSLIEPILAIFSWFCGLARSEQKSSLKMPLISSVPMGREWGVRTSTLLEYGT